MRCRSDVILTLLLQMHYYYYTKDTHWSLLTLNFHTFKGWLNWVILSPFPYHRSFCLLWSIINPNVISIAVLCIFFFARVLFFLAYPSSLYFSPESSSGGYFQNMDTSHRVNSMYLTGRVTVLFQLSTRSSANIGHCSFATSDVMRPLYCGLLIFIWRLQQIISKISGPTQYIFFE